MNFVQAIHPICMMMADIALEIYFMLIDILIY